MISRRIVLVMVAVAFFAAACDDGPVRVIRAPQNVTPKDNAEGELAALWLSGELIAPQRLYETIVSDLDSIRTEYADSTTMVSIEFLPPWVPSEVLVRFTPEGQRNVRDGEYHDFNDLNAEFGLTEMDTSRSLWRNYGTALVRFSGRKHPIVLGQSYEALDDVVWATPNGLIGDWSCVYPWEIDGGMSYLFRRAWGDCPAGCIYSVFWYFRVIDGEIEYVGGYEAWVDPEPGWWAEGRTAFYAYRGYER